MKQFLIALTMLLVACSSTRHDTDLGPSTHEDHAHETQAADVTLRPDEFDAAAPISVAEAAKAAGDGPAVNQETYAARGAEEVATIYACPMHPEVTGTSPGKCPKCGMTLVKRKAK